ncbi:MAG: PAS domain S-box protein [Lacibacter sp.]|nr:PAS domain S-box protein [Lacibacter sp.]
MHNASSKDLLLEIEDLKTTLMEANEAIDAIRNGSVDAFAIKTNGKQEVFTLQSLDYAYRVLIEKFSEGALNVTQDGLILYSNSYFSELIHMPHEKITGSSIFDFIAAESREQFAEQFALALKGSSKAEISLSVHEKSIPVYISLTSLQPQLATVGVIVTDLSEKKRNEELILTQTETLRKKNIELEHLNKSLEQFASIASHDLQEPLRKVQTFTTILEQRFANDVADDAQLLISKIKTSAQRMSMLIKDVLHFSRVVYTEQMFETTDLNEILNNILNDFDLMIHEKKAVIVKEELPVIEAVPLQINQLFYNLVSNALKFSKEAVPPVISISCKTYKGTERSQLNSKLCYTEICFKDNGIGFEQQFAEQIFSIFECLNNRQQYSGTGIGLALCQRIAEHHQGKVYAEASENMGASFYVLLPLTQTVAPEKQNKDQLNTALKQIQ